MAAHPVRLEHRAREVVTVEVAAEEVGVDIDVEATDRVTLTLSAESLPMLLFVREMV